MIVVEANQNEVNLVIKMKRIQRLSYYLLPLAILPRLLFANLDSFGLDEPTIQSLSPTQLKLVLDFLLFDDRMTLEYKETKRLAQTQSNLRFPRKTARSHLFQEFRIFKDIGGLRFSQRSVFNLELYKGNLGSALNARHRIELAAANRILRNLLQRNDAESQQVLREVVDRQHELIFQHLYEFVSQKTHLTDWLTLDQLLREIRLQLTLQDADPGQPERLRLAHREALNLAETLHVEFIVEARGLRDLYRKLLLTRERTWFGQRLKFSETLLQRLIVNSSFFRVKLSPREETLASRAQASLDRLVQIDQRSGRIFSNRLLEGSLEFGERFKLLQSAVSARDPAVPLHLSVSEIATILTRRPGQETNLKSICTANMIRIGARAKP